MDLESKTRQLRLDGYITLVDIQKFLEQRQSIAQPEQYVRYQPGGKKGKVPVLSIDARKGTSKELQAFLADVRGRGERWGIGAETLFGKDAAALLDLAAACKKP